MQAADLGEQDHAVRAGPARVGRAEDGSQVAKARGGQQRVTQSVRGDVPVRVARTAVDAFPEQSGDPALATGLDGVDVDALADPHAFPPVNRASAIARSNGVVIFMAFGWPGTVWTGPPFFSTRPASSVAAIPER